MERRSLFAGLLGRRPRSWPKGVVDLLVKANLLPFSDAKLAWIAWTRARDFDDVTWHEMRLLVPLAARLGEIDPHSPLRPRIDGLAKNLWTQTQFALRETAAAFQCLNEAEIGFIVFKGGAQYAEGLAVSPRRIMGDVDILVRPEQAVVALDALEADQWAATNGESFEYLRQLANVRLSGNFKKGRYGEIDLHISPFHFARIVPALDAALWDRARPATLAFQPILVPDPTDSMLLHLAHSAVSENGDWAIDMSSRIERQTIDWDRLAEMARLRGLVPAAIAGLRYLREELGVAVPEAAIRRLGATEVPVSEALKYWSNVRDRSDRNLAEKLGNRLADHWLRHQGFSRIVKDRRAISVTRPALPIRWLLGLGEHQPLAGQGSALEHRIPLGAASKASDIVVKIRLDRPLTSRRLFFDVAADGVGIARLRSRAGGGRSSAPVTRLFRLPLPRGISAEAILSISSRPVRFLPPNASPAEMSALGPLPFQILGIWSL